jgi:hypothetical protein
MVNYAGSTGSAAGFDLTAGTITNSALGTIKAYPNGWYRCTVFWTIDAGDLAGNPRIDISRTASTSDWASAADANGKSVILWGAQLEQNTITSTYIPTVASTVTRLADTVSLTSASSLIGQTAGTLYTEVDVSRLAGTVARFILTISDGTANNRIYLAFSGAGSNLLQGVVVAGGVEQANINSSAISAIGVYKLALAYSNNDIALYINGVQIGVDASATIPACNQVNIGSNQAGANHFNECVRALALFPTRIANTTLASLTA